MIISLPVWDFVASSGEVADCNQPYSTAATQTVKNKEVWKATKHNIS